MPIAALLINPIANLVTDLVDRIFPDKDKQAQQRAEFLLKAQELDAQLAQGQLAINQAEASSEHLFVSGWRPFIGWVCGAAFAYKFVVQPFLVFILLASHSTFDPDSLPVLDWTEMSTVLLGLLGLGTMRSVEKIKGA